MNGHPSFYLKKKQTYIKLLQAQSSFSQAGIVIYKTQA